MLIEFNVGHTHLSNIEPLSQNGWRKESTKYLFISFLTTNNSYALKTLEFDLIGRSKGLVNDWGQCLFTKIIWREILIEFLAKIIQIEKNILERIEQ